MQVHEHALFPTKLLTIQFSDVDDLNNEIAGIFERPEFGDAFEMHPDALNLLDLADSHGGLAKLREMFLLGLGRWLQGEGIRGELTSEVVLFSNLARKGEFTLVHNHNADVVAVYYVRTPDHSGPALQLPDPDEPSDYFAPEDGVLVLHDPRFNANLAAVRVADYARIYPRPGLMVLFPGYLWHSVTPYLGETKRLAISANFRLCWPGRSNARLCPVRIPAP